MSCSKSSVGDDVAEDDGIAPSPILDMLVAAFSDTSVTLTWTASGDDSTSGTAASYDLRMSHAGIHWGNFDSAQQVTGLPSPKPAGQVEQFTVLGLQTDSTYYFSLRVSDENGNYQGASNCVSATCFNDFTVTIPDTGLQAAIRDRISKPSGDILKSDLTGITDLPADDRAIADLTGLEYCENLIMLNIIGNNVSDLSPLTNLSQLTQLHAGQNVISDITPIAGLSGLTWLRLNENQITDISSLAGLTALTELDLQANSIESLSAVSALTSLESLNLSYNNIRDISPLLDNSGLGGGDHVSLLQNPLQHESVMTHIPTLRSRGVTVHWVDNVAPPGTVTDLSVDTIAATSVTLSWTAPGEDYYDGTAYRYELRYSTTQSDVENWTGGQSVAGLPEPDTAGTVQSVVIGELVEGTTYYFALCTQDNSENWSAVSNIVWAKPYADIVVTFADAALEAVVRDAIALPTGDIHR
ncbi:MAG: leucine-rich repeat domain-containing protein, partial [candidate division Zixibacteria bacterium]|nr:leucine-rich repeat domain-containing protein [candidate division Zixibacteria bacterium]